ncbi:MAG: HlyD family efflux transporter periplasmic adaptor subunit [Acidobacteria bacterium]|nr:HlyD family efflux transporter periplasmic adaptor subunit [Acidobacteriota bacterium]
MKLRVLMSFPLLALLACDHAAPTYQGYVEGEFVSVATSQSGRLDRLSVSRGDTVTSGAPLFALEAANETAARQQASDQVKAAESALADLKQGKRPAEVDAARAQVAQAEAQARNLASQLARDEAQFKLQLISQSQMDQSRAAAQSQAALVRQLKSQLAVALLPSRVDQIRAQEAQVASAKAALAQAEWKLAQKSVTAPKAGLVEDTLYREGEWVASGAPVLRLLPPANVKVRFFVPETALAKLRPGEAVSLRADGVPEVPARITFIATQAEFTPPIIYSETTRTKLVFMVEARPALEDGLKLHPGQPVSVVLK